MILTKRFHRVLLFLPLAIGITGCMSSKTDFASQDDILVPAPEYEPHIIDAVLDAERLNPKPQDMPVIGEEEDEINVAIQDGIPLEMNEEVEKWMHFFTVRRPDLFQRYLDRGENFRAMILPILEENNIPAEMYYLALIESGFVQNARSHAHAVGIWQFIAATGRRYGLRVDSYVDERLDPHRSTIAATLYLNDLRNVFDSWYLAMAAYNAGEMRVLRAIMRGNTRDFWELARNRRLPRETMDYVPKFLAALTIGSNPEKYGFTVPSPKPAPNVTSIAVPAGLHLDKIAEVMNVPVTSLRENNRHLQRQMTPPGVDSYRIWVPSEHEHLFANAEAKLRPHVVRVARGGAGGSFHQVRRGETLSSIANRYGTTVAELRSLNNLRGNRIYAGSRLRVSATAQTASASPQYHQVRRGENLTLIARRYGTTVNEIRRSNRLRSSRIHPGMRLQVNGGQQQTYRVQRGDNLYQIARRFGLTVAELKSLNQLRRNTIYAGQVLTVSRDQG